MAENRIEGGAPEPRLTLTRPPNNHKCEKVVTITIKYNLTNERQFTDITAQVLEMFSRISTLKYRLSYM
jgi:hypothetical protein